MSDPSSADLGDIAHIGHVELLTPRLHDSLGFFTEILGMEQVDDGDACAYPRSYGDYQQWALKLTASDAAGIGCLALRASSEQALQRRAQALTPSGRSDGWSDGDHGHGPAFAFRDPEGHGFELYFSTTRQSTPTGVVKNRYARRGDTPGVGVKRLDHVNVFARDVAANRSFAQEYLGYRLLDSVLDDAGLEEAAFMTRTIAPLELVYVRDAPDRVGRLHHLAFWVDSREDVLRAADVFVDHGVAIEAGPALHTVGSSFFLYALEPGGNRIEVTTGADFVFDPDGPPRVWTAAQRRRGIGWGLQFPDTWKTYGTPV
jgi:catechol 2,3 dioxygenase